MMNLKIGWRALLCALVLAGTILVPPLAAQAMTSAPKLPRASTGGALQVTYTSATLTGKINPHGLETTYVFQYGTTAGYGGQTPLAGAGNGTVEVKVSQTISGLQPGTTYHYRLVAVSPAGTTNGQDHVFVTKKVPLKFTIAKTSKRDVFGSPFSVSGVLSGTGSANRELVLQANQFPFLGGFKAIGSPVLTNAAGGFSFLEPSLSQTTQLRVATTSAPVTYSSVVVENVAVRVTMHVRSTGRPGFVRFYGTVAPAVVGAPVVFQLLGPGGRATKAGSTVVTQATASVSRFSGVVRVRRAGRYRAFVKVSNGMQVSNHSRVIVIR